MHVDFKEALKKPWVKISLGAVVFIGALVVLKSRSGSTDSTSSTGMSAAEINAEAQLEAQQNQISASNSQQSAAIAAQAASQQESDQTGLAAQKESDSTQLSLAGIQLTGLEQQLQTQLQQSQNEMNTQISLSNITANEQTSLATITANEQSHMSDNALSAVQSNNQVAITNSNNQANVAITQSNNAGGGGCFITTAVCEAEGKPDDCFELESLRGFRDTYMRATPERSALVDLYYSTAPMILARLDAFTEDARTEAFAVFRVYIALAVKAISAGQYERAARIYITMLSYASGIAK